MKLIYTKSGFYLNPNTHGFLAILSEYTENVNVIFIAWIPEYLIMPKYLNIFIQHDGLLTSYYPHIHINLGQDETTMIMLKKIESLEIRPPSNTCQGYIQITLKPNNILQSIYYSSEARWPGYDIIDILSHFIFLRKHTNDHLYLVSTDLLKRNKSDECPSSKKSRTHTTCTLPLSTKTWGNLFNAEGKISSTARKTIFERGLDPEIRKEAWKFLLGIYPWDSTLDEREAIKQSQINEYYRVKSVWFDDTEFRESKRFMKDKRSIDTDIYRTNRNQKAFSGEDRQDPDRIGGTNANLEMMKDILVTYTVYNTELGYVQGMSDILAPLFVIMENEVSAFWAFAGFMDKMQNNFYMDQSGMHAQIDTLGQLVQFMDPVLYKRFKDLDVSNLFFSFRWLLVWFKREFEWDDVMKLWEILWTNWLTDKMLLFVALSVISTHREKILNELEDFDDILRFMDSLSGNIDLKSTLEKAKVLFFEFEKKIQDMQHKSNEIKKKLGARSVWNSEKRYKLQQDIDNLKIPDSLFNLLPCIPE